MTALGSYEHFQCDQCKTNIRVAEASLVGSAVSGEARPMNWAVLKVKVHTSGSRLESLRHLCSTCRDSLDRHFFGPRTCDAPKIDELEKMLKTLHEIASHDAGFVRRLPLGDSEKMECLLADVRSYFNPGIAVES